MTFKWARRSLRDPFSRDLIESYAARFCLLGLQAVLGIFIARILGPERRGQLATAGALGAMGVQFGILGLHSANNYFAAREPDTRQALFGNGLVAGAVFGLLGAAIGLALNEWVLGLALDGFVLIFTLAQIPLQTTSQLLQNLLAGMNRIRSSNVVDIVGGTAIVVAYLSVLSFRTTTVGSLVLAGSLASLFPLACAFYSVHSWIGWPRTNLSLFARCVPYGLRAYLACFLMFLVLRVDVLMVETLLGMEAVGQYAVAVSLCDMVFIIPQVLSTIIFPRLASCGDATAQRQLVRRSVWLVLAILVPLAILMFVFANTIIRTVFGIAFEPASATFRWLLPGIVMLGVNSLLMQYFASLDMPWFVVLSPLAACLFNVLLNCYLIPSLGTSGAAISSTLAYGTLLAAGMGYFIYRRPLAI